MSFGRGRSLATMVLVVAPGKSVGLNARTKTVGLIVPRNPGGMVSFDRKPSGCCSP
jgi:hypothetical protein